VGGAGIVYLVLTAFYARPIADDWSALATLGHVGFVDTLTSSGRYTTQALVWIVVRLFGAGSAQATPLIVLAATWAASGWGLRVVARAAGLTVPLWELAALALLAVVACVSVAPSLIDNVAWLSGVAGYTTPLAAAACLTAVCWQLASRNVKHPVIAGIAVLAGGFATAGFHELVGAVLCAAALLALLTARDLRSSRSLLGAIAAGGTGAVAGLTLNLTNPATSRRASNQHAHVGVVAALHTAWHDLSFFSAAVEHGLVALALALGVVLWQLFGSALTPRLRRWMFAWSAFLILVPWLIVSAVTAWARATESGDRAPFRTAFLFTSAAALGTALLVVALLSLAPRLLSQRRASLVALVLAAAGLVALAHAATPLLRAERLRVQAVAQRAASVERQLASGRTRIQLLPAPLLAVDTQALDLSFAPIARQRPALVKLLRSYYDVPPRDTVTVVSRQPRGYCLPGVAASWVGVQSCQELDGER